MHIGSGLLLVVHWLLPFGSVNTVARGYLSSTHGRSHAAATENPTFSQRDSTIGQQAS
jgi:hypothetical protein